MEFVDENLLTCPSDLALSLGAEDELFLKGMLTFHPFVTVWKEKRRKSIRERVKDGGGRGRGNEALGM